MRESARVVATELIRKPVKEAVREALHEESASVRSAGETGESSDKQSQGSGEHQQGQQSSESDDQESGGGRSKLATLGILVAIAGVAVLARRRMSSTSGEAWSRESSPGSVARDDAESGYVSEGEMQTAETAGEGGSNGGGTGGSTSTTSEQ